MFRGKDYLELDSHDSKEFLCQSKYDGDLQWYKVTGNGSEAEIPYGETEKNSKSLIATKKKVVQIKFREHHKAHGLILSARLLLKNVLPEDSGEYVCKKINTFRRSRKRLLRINIKGKMFIDCFKLSDNKACVVLYSVLTI